MKNYFEQATVLKIVNCCGFERDIILRIKNRTAKSPAEQIEKGTIECFDSDLPNIEENKTYSIKLRIDFNKGQNRLEEKKFEYIKITPLAKNQYKIFGQVVAKMDKEYVIDCGFYVFIDPTKNLRLGDWITTKGRLDMHMAKDNCYVTADMSPVVCL